MTTNWLDIILLFPLVVGVIRGLMRGLVSEVIAILVVILGVLGSHMLSGELSVILLESFNWAQGVCDVVAHVLVFLAIAILLSILAKLLTKFIRAIHLGWANRLFGGVFGLCKYGVLVLCVIFIMDRTNQVFHYLDEAPIIKTSIVYPYGVKVLNSIVQHTETITTTTTTTTTKVTR